jgi:Fic family protein
MSYSEKRKQIDLLQEKINAHGALSAEVKKKINYKFRLDWNYYSNSMEGNTLTKDETRSVMIGNLTIGGKPIKDVLEMNKHNEVISEIMKIGKGEARLSEGRIREIHKGIMHEEDESKMKKIGTWKTEPNYILNYKGEKFQFALPAEVPARMHELLNRTNAAIDSIEQNKNDAAHPVDIALKFHLEFVSIHPFYDGNGRTARILTNLLLIFLGYPPFWVKTNERNTYNQYIADIQGYGGKPDVFFDFAAEMILRSQQLIIDAIEGKNIEDEDDLDKELALLKASLKGEDVYKVAASSQNIADAIEDNIIPICRMIEKKCGELNDLFFDFDKKIYFGFKQEGGSKKLGSKESEWDILIENWLHKQIRKENKQLSEFRFFYELKGLKKTDNANSFTAGIEIYFHDYYYVANTREQRGREIKIAYEKKLPNDEINDIAKPIIKSVIEEIKRATGKL